MPVVFICSPHLLSSYIFGHDRSPQQDANYANVQVELKTLAYALYELIQN
jgi:hypothetical protein